MLRFIPIAVSLSLITGWASAVFAHDFWVEPAALHAAVGTAIKIDLKVGHGADATTLPRNPDRFEKFVLVGSHGETDIVGADGTAPAGVVRVDAAGVYVVGYRSRHATSELEARRFESYLREEGLEKAITRRAELGQSEKPGRERYSRCAKALIVIGDPPREGFDRAIGMPLELISLEDPRDLGPGKEASFRLLFQGKPVADVLVRATRMDLPMAEPHSHPPTEPHTHPHTQPHTETTREAEAEPTKQPAAEHRSRTDGEGLVKFELDSPGTWRLNAVHISELPPGGMYEWESLWASLVFEVR